MAAARANNKNNNNGTGEPIKRVLRRKKSQQYFKDGGWTDNLKEASCFSDAVQVAETCARYGLSGVELALRFETAECDVFCTPIR